MPPLSHILAPARPHISPTQSPSPLTQPPAIAQRPMVQKQFTNTRCTGVHITVNYCQHTSPWCQHSHRWRLSLVPPVPPPLPALPPATSATHAGNTCTGHNAPFYYTVDLSYILLISYFMAFVPTSTQRRYRTILPPYFVVAYVPTSMQ